MLQQTSVFDVSGHDEFPKFAVDTLTDMLGSVKPYGRQVCKVQYIILPVKYLAP